MVEYPQMTGSVAEFIYALERNGDLVRVSAYAPLFYNTASKQASQWRPSLIAFGMLTVEFELPMFRTPNAHWTS